MDRLNAQQQISIKQMDYRNKPLNVNYNNAEAFACNVISSATTINAPTIEQVKLETVGDILDIVADTDANDSDEVKCIFLCKFHATAGPQIAAQVPKNYISKELFDTVSSYIIPKVPLQRSFLSV